MRTGLRALLRLALLAAIPVWLTGAAAAADEEQLGEELSERTVRVLQSLAWDRMPERLEDDDATIELDKSDPQAFLLPVEDAKRVIFNANRSATASLCDLDEEAVVNFLAMMDVERASEKWTREQLHMIKWIYLAVIEVRTGYLDERPDDEDGLSSEEAAEYAQDPKRQERQDYDCTDETRQTVKRQIAEFAHAASTE